MEWLSAEEKTRSMMPYLLDLPPLDKPEETKDSYAEEIKTKAKTAKKKTKESENEK